MRDLDHRRQRSVKDAGLPGTSTRRVWLVELGELEMAVYDLERWNRLAKRGDSRTHLLHLDFQSHVERKQNNIVASAMLAKFQCRWMHTRIGLKRI